MFKIINLLFVTLILSCYYQEIAGECCYGVTITYRCEDSSFFNCKKKYCLDGNINNGGYCGVGKCNFLGCSCDGGCRKGSDENAIEKKFKNENPNLRVVYPNTRYGRK